MRKRHIAVLVIHGFSSSSIEMEELVADLNLEPKFDVFAFTLSGHKDGKLKGVSKEDWKDDVEEWMMYLLSQGYRKVYLVGHSMGAMLAVELAVKYKQVKKLVLVSPGVYCGSFLQMAEDIAHPIKAIKEEDSSYQNMIRKLFRVNRKAHKELRKLIAEERPLLDEVTCPILVMQGDKDEVVPKKASYYAYRHVKSKKKELIIVEGGRHNLLLGSRRRDCIRYIHKYLKGGLSWILRKRVKKSKMN